MYKKCCEICPFLRANRVDYIKFSIFVYNFKRKNISYESKNSVSHLGRLLAGHSY